MPGPETRINEKFPLVPFNESYQQGNGYASGDTSNSYDFSIGDYSMQFDFPDWPDFPEPLPEEDPPEPDESALEGLLRFDPGTTKLQQYVGGDGWTDVTFESSDPGGGQIWDFTP